MTAPSLPRVFRSSPLLLGVSALQCVATAYIARYLWQADGATLLTWGAVAVAAVSLGALAEAMRTRVTLDADSLEVRTLWGTRRVPRAEVREVVVARGGKAGVRLTDDGWLRLPSMGAQLAEAVREWSRC